MPTTRPEDTIKYFGYGTNADKEMMAHIVGRMDLNGDSGQLIGYQLCVQSIDQIRDTIPPTSPIKESPRDIIRRNFGDAFDLFIAIPKPDAIVHGTIWYLTPLEIESVKNWELVDCGMQEEVQALAMDSKGQLLQVETQAVVDPPAEYHTTIDGDNYEKYLVEKSKILSAADNVRNDFLKIIKNKKS